MFRVLRTPPIIKPGRDLVSACVWLRHLRWSTAAVPNLSGTRDWFLGRQFFYRSAWGLVSGWFKHIAFIVHFIFIIITSAPPQSSGVRYQRLGTPEIMLLFHARGDEGIKPKFSLRCTLRWVGENESPFWLEHVARQLGYLSAGWTSWGHCVVFPTTGQREALTKAEASAPRSY